jgi:serine/threonine-protein kinase HipA
LIDDTWWARLPQEDFCQVSGLPSASKYEDNGGPGIRDILGILRGSDTPEADRQQFLAAQLLFWLLAAPDGHAKNFSLFLGTNGRYKLTPLYDIMSAWPVIGAGPKQFQWQKVKLAMAVRTRNAHYKMSTIQRRHWNEVAKVNGVGEDFESVIQRFMTQAPIAIEAVTKRIPSGFPQVVSDAIFAGIRAQVERLGQQGSITE